MGFHICNKYKCSLQTSILAIISFLFCLWTSIVHENCVLFLENIQIIFIFWMTLPKSKQPEESKSYICLKADITNSLMSDVSQFFFFFFFFFFVNTAKVLNKFLVAYQTEKPVVLFLAQSRNFHEFLQLDVLIDGHIKQS